MHYLKYDAMVIDHMIASIFITQKEDKASSIKFGSYDKNAIECCNDLTMIKTKDLSSWSVNLNKAKLLN